MSAMEGNLKAQVNIPIIRIRSDWQDGIRKCEKVWVSCYSKGEKPIYGNILSNGARNLADMQIEVDGDFAVELLCAKSIKVVSKSQNVSSIFHAPFTDFRNIHNKSIRSLDVSPSGSLGISSSDDGSLKVWNTSDGVVRRCLEGHVSDVTHCRFFPSGLVALSGGIDMRLRIWSVENGSCPRVLTGHKAAITDSAIVDKGRNVITCSRDGTAKLWDCGQGKCKGTIVDAKCVINSCALRSCSPGNLSGEMSMEEGFDAEELNDKLLTIAREDGMLEVVEVQSGKRIFQSNCHSAVNCCGFIDDHQIIGGCENGAICCFDLRGGSSATSVYSMGESSVNHLQIHRGKLFIARGDGSLQVVNPLKNNIGHIISLTGPNADPVYRISCHGNEVYSACRDGVVRKYCLDLNLD